MLPARSGVFHASVTVRRFSPANRAGFPLAGGPPGPYTLPPHDETRAKEHSGQKSQDNPEKANTESIEAVKMPIYEEQQDPFAGP